MADWPASGSMDWNTKMLANLAIGHETDGTHNQEDWTPSTYVDEESVTFPNGLIIKMGRSTKSTTQTVTFGTEFPNSIITVIATLSSTDNTENVVVSSEATTGFRVDHNSGGASTVNWVAVGR